MRKNGSLGGKILLAMIVLVLGILIIAGTIFAFAMNSVSDTLVSSNQSLNDTIGDMSSVYMTEQSQKRLLELAGEKADIADHLFSEFERGVCTVASVAEQIYSSPALYGERAVPLPDPEKDGELTIQVLYSAGTDPADPEIKQELSLIGNVQDVLLAVNESQDEIASIYVATESGFMVQADYISAKKYDESAYRFLPPLPKTHIPRVLASCAEFLFTLAVSFRALQVQACIWTIWRIWSIARTWEEAEMPVS